MTNPPVVADTSLDKEDSYLMVNGQKMHFTYEQLVEILGVFQKGLTQGVEKIDHEGELEDAEKLLDQLT